MLISSFTGFCLYCVLIFHVLNKNFEAIRAKNTVVYKK